MRLTNRELVFHCGSETKLNNGKRTQWFGWKLLGGVPGSLELCYRSTIHSVVGCVCSIKLSSISSLDIIYHVIYGLEDRPLVDGAAFADSRWLGVEAHAVILVTLN